MNNRSTSSDTNLMPEDNSGEDRVFENRISTTRWLNTKEASAYLGISPNALRILVHRGKIRAHKLGHRLKFQIVALNAALHEKEGYYGN